MEPVELPLLPSNEEGVCYLFLPGFEEDEVKGVEYQVDWDRAVMNVYLYEGENDDKEIEGVRVPVIIDEENTNMVQDMTTLYVTDPRKISPGDVGEDDYLLLKEEFERWKENHY